MGHANKLTRSEIDTIVQEITHRLVEAAHPEKVILFGSYAREDFDERSDLDLLVILPTVENRAEEMIRLRSLLKGIPVAIDIVVYSVDEVEQRRELRGTMLHLFGKGHSFFRRSSGSRKVEATFLPYAESVSADTSPHHHERGFLQNNVSNH